MAALLSFGPDRGVMPRAVLVRDLALERWPSMNRYAEELARALRDLEAEAGGERDDAWEITVPPEYAAASRSRFPLPASRYLKRYWLYPRQLRRHPADLVHVLDHSYAHCLRAFPEVPSVVTLHDLYPVEVMRRGQRALGALARDRLLRWVMDWVARADGWIAVSEFTAEEAVRLLRLPAARIRVVPNGVSDAFFRRPPESVIAARRAGWMSGRRVASPPASPENRAGPALPSGSEAPAAGASRPAVLLHVGSCDPRKNVSAALAALRVLRRRGLDAILVQIGGRFSPALSSLIRSEGLEPFVIQEAGVEEAALANAYHAADALILPSTYEGFAFPALEAMAADLPVVTSGGGALRETVGPAAIIADPASPERFADAIERVLTDGSERSRLVSLGRERAARYTWPRAARAVRAVYDELRHPARRET